MPYKKPRRLTQYVFRSQLPQILELEVDVNNGHTTCDSEDNYVTAVGFLWENRGVIINSITLKMIWNNIQNSWRLLTSSTLAHSFQVHTCLLAARLFIDTRQTVRARVPTITSHGWEATRRPWNLNKRANMVQGDLSSIYDQQTKHDPYYLHPLSSDRGCCHSQPWL